MSIQFPIIGRALAKLEPGAERPVSERELLLFMKSKVVRQIEIRQTGHGSFRLRIRLSVDPNDFVLSGTRNKPREWASLDTLANHISVKFGEVRPVILLLRPDGGSGSACAN